MQDLYDLKRIRQLRKFRSHEIKKKIFEHCRPELVKFQKKEKMHSKAFIKESQAALETRRHSSEFPRVYNESMQRTLWNNM